MAWLWIFCFGFLVGCAGRKPVSVADPCAAQRAEAQALKTEMESAQLEAYFTKWELAECRRKSKKTKIR